MENYAQAGKCLLTWSTWSYNQLSTFWHSPEPEGMYWQAMGPRIRMQGGISPFLHQVTREQPQEEATHKILKKGWTEVEWEGENLDVLTMHIEGENSYRQRYWILTKKEAVARRFLAAVCAWNTEIRSEVLVFDSGQWYKDEKLFHNIQGINFDSLSCSRAT